MEILEFIKKAEGGRIIVEVPQELEGKELFVQVRASEGKPNGGKLNQMPIEEREKYIMQFYGTAKYPDYPTDKHDVYDQ